MVGAYAVGLETGFLDEFKKSLIFDATAQITTGCPEYVNRWVKEVLRCQVSSASLVAAYSSILAMCCGVRRSLEAVSARSIPACFAFRTLRSSGRRFGGELVVGATS